MSFNVFNDQIEKRKNKRFDREVSKQKGNK